MRIVSLTTALWLFSALNDCLAQQTQYQCHTNVQLCTDPILLDCAPIPTSLRPLVYLADTDTGWSPGGACGTTSCNLFLRCPCGNSLSKSVCDGAGGGACDCGPHIGPCTFSVNDLNKMLDGGKVKALSRELPAESLYLPPVGKPILRDQASALHRLRSFYQSFSTAYMNAGAWFNFPNKTGDGAVELWLNGSAYRVRETIDPRLGLASGLEAAYDGEHYQLLYLDDSRLTLSREDPIQRPAPFPDPLFLPLAFLSPESDACQACVLTLQAAQDNARWQERIGAGRTVESSSKALVLALPGTRIAGQPFYFRVVIDPVHDLVSRIEWVRQDGKIIKALELLRYEKAEGSKQLFPRHLVMNAFDEQGKRLGSAHFMVKELRLNVPIDAERFQIPFSAAGTVIDEDAHTFLKHPQLIKDGGSPPNH